MIISITATVWAGTEVVIGAALEWVEVLDEMVPQVLSYLLFYSFWLQIDIVEVARQRIPQTNNSNKVKMSCCRGTRIPVY